ncbi:MAG: TraY domain-containing protein [Rickettsiaceae bacterium]|jgi:RHH-type rel operon transcriptional repressor/antitoxin RelB|nr:TraY domain-containing protein [Rickettsiaceae bacterium]HCY39102.1 CopG family transcriptional regulator [Neisseriales bacterium]
MLAIRLDDDTEKRLNFLAAQTHRTKSFYVKQALLEYLDDLEDIYLAEKELEDIRAGRSDIISWKDVKAKAGL